MKFLAMLTLAWVCLSASAQSLQDQGVSVEGLKAQLVTTRQSLADIDTRLQNKKLPSEVQKHLMAEQAVLQKTAVNLRASIEQSERIARMPGVMFATD